MRGERKGHTRLRLSAVVLSVLGSGVALASSATGQVTATVLQPVRVDFGDTGDPRVQSAVTVQQTPTDGGVLVTLE